MTPGDKDIPLARAVGRFVGHLWHAASKPVPERARAAQTETHTTRGAINGQPVVLRRTVIEEIEFENTSKDPSKDPAKDPSKDPARG